MRLTFGKPVACLIALCASFLVGVRLSAEELANIPADAAAAIEKVLGHPAHKPPEAEVDENRNEKVTPEDAKAAREMLAGAVHLDVESPEFEALLNGKNLALNADQNLPTEVVHQYRTSSGRTFHAQEKSAVKLRLPKIPDELAHHRIVADALDQATSIPPLKRCPTDETLTVPSKDPQAGPDTVLMDMLFLPDDATGDVAALFGANTWAISYKKNSSGRVSPYFKLLGVPCLPYRMRQTNKAVIRDFGENALKNYSEDPYGAGRMNSAVREKFNAYLQSR